jgi:hypothetical protein
MKCPALALCLSLTAAPILAETVKPDVDPAALSHPGPVARLVLAQDLFFQGLATHDPLALIQSARMMLRVGIIEAPDRLPVASGKKLKTDAPPPVPFPAPQATLATAEALAQGDDLLLSLIDATRSTEQVPQGGVRRSQSALPPGGTEVWTVAFFGRAPAELAVLGNGQSTLTITVADASGQTPCATTAAADRIYCRFTPLDNGSFTITVTNPGKAVDAYMLITN